MTFNQASGGLGNDVLDAGGFTLKGKNGNDRLFALHDLSATRPNSPMSKTMCEGIGYVGTPSQTDRGGSGKFP